MGEEIQNHVRIRPRDRIENGIPRLAMIVISRLANISRQVRKIS